MSFSAVVPEYVAHFSSPSSLLLSFSLRCSYVRWLISIVVNGFKQGAGVNAGVDSVTTNDSLLCAAVSEPTLGAGDVDREARLELLGIRRCSPARRKSSRIASSNPRSFVDLGSSVICVGVLRCRSMQRLNNGVDAGKYRAGLRPVSLTVQGRYWSTKPRAPRGSGSRLSGYTTTSVPMHLRTVNSNRAASGNTELTDVAWTPFESITVPAARRHPQPSALDLQCVSPSAGRCSSFPH